MIATSGVFGAGRGEPYVRVLTGPRPASLVLRSVDGSHDPFLLDVGSWVRAASPADLTALDAATGPTLDVGCGPGRMVRAAAARAIPALGIDIASHAVARTRVDGSLALQRSVFDRLPLEGRWQTILLMDGNLGIGGDPEALFRRCAALLAPGGSLVIEVDPDDALAVCSTCVLVDDDGHESDPFPWARMGTLEAESAVVRAGLAVVMRWAAAGRQFLRAARAEEGDARRTPATAATATVMATRAQATASELA
ncbi:class I SAM-dependent methyltransferase [Agromyces salentinus]|uniref:Class I SAM-dependent methyltransferase n=1 Tax=Agromyces salentinus TaxID=269421 RepID=A0ABN2MQZ4_9MICO|nr:methyltransferase domain-containing protein [Agromyces salentinus]